jgi:hypothetical protein
VAVNELVICEWIGSSSGIVISTKTWTYHIFHDSFYQYCVSGSINPTMFDVIWIQMTFIPEEFGIKRLNRTDFLKYFNFRRILNRWIKAISYPVISIPAVSKIL